jgi:hypothetical protein
MFAALKKLDDSKDKNWISKNIRRVTNILATERHVSMNRRNTKAGLIPNVQNL